MNERIKELADEALQLVAKEHTNGDESRLNTDSYHVKDLIQEKFAELIVKECVDITSGLSKLYPRTDVAFDVGYTMGTTRATKEIKEHFGVEE